jgi:hypothetical protein
LSKPKLIKSCRAEEEEEECEGHAGLYIEREAITALNAARLQSQSIAVFQHNPPTLPLIRPILTRVTKRLLNNNGALMFPFPHYCKIDDVLCLAAAVQTAWRTVLGG